MKLGLVSDTHVPTAISELPPQLVESLQDVDLILHAGDLVRLDVLDSLQQIARTIAVRGNADEPAVKEALPRKRLLNLAGRAIGLIHGNRRHRIEREYRQPSDDYASARMSVFYDYLTDQFPEADVIVFGHFHLPVIMRRQGRLLINPGSVAPREGRSTVALLEVSATGENAEVITL